jgi:imidazolonepropionase-like amidohydrolase
MKSLKSTIFAFCLLTLSTGDSSAQTLTLTVIQADRLIDGTGNPPLVNAQILIRDDRIVKVGKVGSFMIPPEAKHIDGSGKTLLPGFVDLHFHMEGRPPWARQFLANGVTSVRDPGAWMEYFEPLKQWQRENHIPGPRLFLCGPHLDGPGPAYPKDSVVMLSPDEARLQTRRQIEQGATAIKVYFRLPLNCIKAVTEEAHRLKVPVTAHLEIINPIDAIEAGLDGIEHITSLGLALVPAMQGEKYRQAVLKDNDVRHLGRYEMWASIDMNGTAAKHLLQFLAAHQTFIDPNLAVFERRRGDSGEQMEIQAQGWEKMKQFTGMIHQAGGRIVVGSHSQVPHAEFGFAYQRELELLVEAGLTPLEALVAATKVGAEFLGRSEDLGTLEEGKLADVIAIDGNPLDSISATRKVSLVMVNGVVVDRTRLLAN